MFAHAVDDGSPGFMHFVDDAIEAFFAVARYVSRTLTRSRYQKAEFDLFEYQMHVQPVIEHFEVGFLWGIKRPVHQIRTWRTIR